MNASVNGWWLGFLGPLPARLPGSALAPAVITEAVMTESDARFLDAFSGYLKSLAVDAECLAKALEDESLGVPARLPLASALNYLFKSLDLIDDGIEGLGFLDDALVLRLAASHARGEFGADVARLASEADLVREFAGDLGPRLEAYVDGLRDLSVRGRTPLSIASEAAVREEFLSDVRSWAARYERPNFTHDSKNLVKLRAFLGAKLPA